MSQRIVVKLGTSVLTNSTTRLSRQRMLEIVQQVAKLHQQGHEVIVVSSGAQAAGRERLNYLDRDRSMPAKQMLSSVGQGRLMQMYSGLFDIFDIVVGQVLLTRGDLDNRIRYLNARDTLLTLIDHRIIPIINENDTTATEEIRVGDNDNLSALVANLLEADLLVILTDQQGLFTADPRRSQDASLIKQVKQINSETYAIAGGVGTDLGTGGMVTKVQAAQLASRSGVTTVIADGGEPDVLVRLLDGVEIGTRFEAQVSHLESRKRWLVMEKPRGVLRVDAGAARAVTRQGASLLPVGITAIEGEFERGETLSVFEPSGIEIAHGVTNYSSADIQQLHGLKSQRIIEILGYSYGDAVIHRNNMVVLG